LEPLNELHRFAGVEVLSEELYDHTSNSRLVAFWHSLCGGIENFPQWLQAIFSTPQGLYRPVKIPKMEDVCQSSRQRKEELWDASTHNICTDIKTATRGRRFFNTQKGYFGFGPGKCKIGDLVVVLAGGRVPYTIRPAPESARAPAIMPSMKCYTILGDSYVHGIMDGEVFELLNENERELKEIVLV